MNRVEILGVPVDPLTQQSVVPALQELLESGKQHHVMTPNSEMLVHASRDEEFREILLDTSLNLPDSAGLLWAAKWTNQELPERVTGIDTVMHFCMELTEEHPIYLLGAREGVAERTAEILKQQNPRLRVAGTFAGNPDPVLDRSIQQFINDAAPHILLVAYGAPKQDKWIERNLKKLPSVRLAIGVGGTFDFITRTQKRAPEWMQHASLEWLWRLIQEPRRIGRIITAVMVFPLLVFIYGKKAPQL